MQTDLSFEVRPLIKYRLHFPHCQYTYLKLQETGKRLDGKWGCLLFVTCKSCYVWSANVISHLCLLCCEPYLKYTVWNSSFLLHFQQINSVVDKSNKTVDEVKKNLKGKKKELTMKEQRNNYCTTKLLQYISHPCHMFNHFKTCFSVLDIGIQLGSAIQSKFNGTLHRALRSVKLLDQGMSHICMLSPASAC